MERKSADGTVDSGRAAEPVGRFPHARRVENLLPACKNLGTTHLTNGCYRLHPVEWNIGESVGELAAFCAARQVSPRAVLRTPELLADYQRQLTDAGIPLAWPKTG